MEKTIIRGFTFGSIAGMLITFLLIFAGCQDRVEIRNAQAKTIAENADDLDAGSGARIDPQQVYQVFKVEEPCSTGVSARFAVTTGRGVGAEFYPTDSVKTANRWKFFTVKPEKFGTYMKKRYQWNVTTVIYMEDKANARWKRMQIFFMPPVWDFLPTYSKKLYVYKCTGPVISDLN